MKKLMLCTLLFMAFTLSGCLIRMVPYEVDRVDQELGGNRGVVRGKTSVASESEENKTKTMYRIEIELPDSSDKEIKDTKEDKAPVKTTSGGNKGYMQVKKSYEREENTQKKKRGNVVRLGSSSASSQPQVVFQQAPGKKGKYSKEKGAGALIAKEEPKTYVVKKGDTLQKISDKMYGTTKRWKEIYEANKATLKSPDIITPGQEITIP